MKKHFISLFIAISCVACTNENMPISMGESNYAYQDAPYLDISEKDAKNFSKDDWRIFAEATARLKTQVRKGKTHVLQHSGKEVNISERLFIKVKESFENANYLSSQLRKKRITRLMDDDYESNNYTGNDCVGQSIAQYLGLDVNMVNDSISAVFPEYRNGAGLPLSQVLAAVQLFKPNAMDRTRLVDYDFDFYLELSGIVILQNENDANGHAVVVTSAYKSGASYILSFYDRQNSSAITGCYNSVGDLPLYSIFRTDLNIIKYIK